VNLFLLHFRNSTVFHVSCIPGCLPELSNDNNQPSTKSYALLGHDYFNLMTNIDLIAFILTRRHAYIEL